MSAKRIDAVRKVMKAENLDGLVVSHIDHVRYLTGFTGSAGLLIVGPQSADFLTDGRYKEQSAAEVKGAKITIVTTDLAAALKEFKSLKAKNRRYGYAGEYLTISSLNRLQESLDGCLLVEANEVFAELGWVKDREEIGAISRAARIADKAFDHALAMIVPGVTENDLRAELEYQMRVMGSEEPAFRTIVASGWRSALPHGVASNKRVKKGEFITFDFGATVEGYVCDITRTVVLGKATSRQKRIYELVLRAQKAGIRKIKAGIKAKVVDEACRRIIAKAGHGKAFSHGTGHGIGYFVHVGPRVSAKSKDKLRAGNVITVEPGVYFPGWGGVRIEDDVVVTRAGGRVLNKAPKYLLEL